MSVSQPDLCPFSHLLWFFLIICKGQPWGDVSGFIYTCPFHCYVCIVTGTPSWEQEKKCQHLGMCGVSSIYT